ncbi:hypothetical protein R1sor_005475 [Riccia sorocarpa]|uniref:Cyclase n=1 Tax=Riccia sorocarpa TaxID=122646 RepID=A0ABD3HN83_9MARC
MKVCSLILLLWITVVNALELVDEAYPSIETLACAARSAGTARVEKKRITDITHELRPDLPSFGGEFPVTDAVKLVRGMRRDKEICNLSELKIIVHSGTHVDAPGHFINEFYEAGYDVNGLDLEILVGPVLIVDVSKEEGHITEQVLQKLKIPRGVERVIFKTANTPRRLMYKPEFDTSYVGFTKEGAEWLVTNTDIKLVGIDYLSVAIAEDPTGPHEAFLSRKLILVEALKLDEVDAGLSTLYCLPLRLIKAEGSPARCILIS